MDINDNNNDKSDNVNDRIRNKPNLYCELCDFQATRPIEFIRHVETKKHIRNGKKIKDTIYRCDKCDKTLSNHFSYKIHMIQVHATVEEKLKQPYYCKCCDVVFVSKLYMDKHLIGKKHNNVARSLELIEEIKKKVENINV